MKPSFVIAAAAALLLAGCSTASSVSHRKPVTRVIVPAVTARPVAATTGAAPGQMYPGQALPMAQTPASQGTPVFLPPKITKTVLAPYEDEKGRLFGPQVMYQVVQEGHMNVNALQNPDLAYIPPENIVVPPGMGNPVSTPAMQRAAEEAPRLSLDTIDPRDVTVTGLLSKIENRAEAERMAKAAGRRAVFDPDIGWILVPTSVVK